MESERRNASYIAAACAAIFLTSWQVLEFESAHLDSLPNAEMYERSYMHRENLSHVAVAQATEFFITASVDGHIKFWKKKGEGLEFAKHFRAHLGPVKGDRRMSRHIGMVANDKLFCPAVIILRYYVALTFDHCTISIYL